MLRYIARRLLFGIPILVISSAIVFVAVRSFSDPSAAIRSNPRLTNADLLAYRKALGLDKSGFQQYLAWLRHFLQGDWGKSLVSQRSVGPDIQSALANTAVLGMSAFVVSLFIGVTVGLISAIRQYSPFDYLATGGAFFGLSMPTFWFGLIVQLIFGVYLIRWFHLSEPFFFTAGMFAPGTTGFHVGDRLRHLFLPGIVLAVQLIAVYSRYMRASMLEVLSSDFLRTARAKGLRERTVIVKHGMRNALIPITTQVAIDIGGLVSGLIVTEQIFQWPGMGTLFLKSINSGDYAVVLPWVMVTVSAVIIFNLMADLMYAVLDPRIRYG